MEILPIPKDNFSFIRARDPSIISYNYCSQINPGVRVNLCDQLSNEESMDLTESKESVKIDNEHIKVYLRIKPYKNSNEVYEIKDNTLICHVPEGSRLFRKCKEGDKILKKFHFSKIYGPDITQEELFNDCIKEKVLQFINGSNSTLFTYGASGSGKTFTILGEENNPGIIPRALEYIFRTLPRIHDTEDTILVKPLPGDDIELLDKTASKQERIARNNVLNSSNSSMNKIHSRTYRNMQQRLSQEPVASLEENYGDLSLSIWVSFAEVYNEYVYDLLQSAPRGSTRSKLSLGLDVKGKTFIKNLTSINVTSGLEAYEVLQYGMHNLNYASTSINKHSSRSHCIFTIKLVQTSLSTSKAQISHFNFCDLAGAERTKSSCSTGDRLKESNNINTSLHVLGRCIKSIRESQKNNDKRLIPFRESKLTSLFQPALTGQESIAMIVNMNPNKDLFDESQHVLNFSAITKDIVVESAPKPVEVTIKNRFSEFVETNKLPEISTISECDEDEYDLRQQVEILKVLLKKSEAEKNKIELKVRSEFVALFRKELENDRESHKEDVKRMKRNLEEYHENKLQDLKNYYDKVLQNKNKSELIDLTKDEEIEELKQENYELRRKNNELSNKCNTLHSVLNEAREDYIELKKKYKKVRKELTTLQMNLAEETEEDL